MLRERGLRAIDVRAMAGAAGGPKGLALNPLDRFIFGHWLQGATHTVHLLGSSIGAWRMACACTADPDAALATLADDYIAQRYQHAPGKPPAPSHVSAVFAETLERRLVPHAQHVLAHPTRRLHVFTSRGLGPLARQGRWRTPIGYLGAWAANAVHRRAMGVLLERVVFSDRRDPMPIAMSDYRTRCVELTERNLAASVLASCSIPLWLDAVHGIDGAPAGAYWDGGITDYHLHLNYASLGDALVLIPHFQPTLVPGWLDKPFKWRHRASAALDNAVLLVPDAAWVRSLPRSKLPDRSDFRHHGDDHAARGREWRVALAESQRLADELAELIQRPHIEAEALS